MKEKIVAQSKNHLKELIANEIALNGNNCDLNHIDVSFVEDMSDVFRGSSFNGNISKWNVSKVKSMYCLFYDSQFNGEISKWDVSKVEDMYGMFNNSLFNGNISGWDVSNVKDMCFMFYNSQFSGETGNWNALNLQSIMLIFYNCPAPMPYWAQIKDFEERQKTVEVYHTHKILNQTIKNNNKNVNTLKI